MEESSFLAEIIEELSNALVKTSEATDIINAAADFFSIEGKKLEDICKQHPRMLAKYDALEKKLKSIEDVLKLKKEEKEGILWRKYVENYSRQLSSTDIKAYIQADKEIVTLNQTILEVNYTKQQAAAIVEALKSLGWSLKYIVELRVNQLQDIIL